MINKRKRTTKDNEIIDDKDNFNAVNIILGGIVSVIVYIFMEKYFKLGGFRYSYVSSFFIMFIAPVFNIRNKVYWFIIEFCLGYFLMSILFFL